MIAFFLTTSLGRSILAGVGIAALLGGAYFYIDHKARVDERNAAAGKTLQETEDARKTREGIENSERARTDRDATKCLQSITGC